MELNINQNLQASLQQRLELYLSPKVIQMLKVLNLPYTELIDRIEKESEENVMLEVEKPERLSEYIRFINTNKKESKQLDYNEYPGIKDIKTINKSLDQFLLDQLALENPDDPYDKICEALIKNIDDRGYLTNYYELRDKFEKEFGVSRTTIDHALKIIQSFEPDGIGARNIKECLEIQINEYNFENLELQDVLLEVVSNHLEALSEGKFEEIANKLEIKPDGIKYIATFIKENLTPFPAAEFGGEARQVIPSFSIEEKSGNYRVVNLEKEYGPKLSISAQYQAMLQNDKTDEETKKYLKEKLAAAQELIDNINRRQETFQKIIVIITQTQIPYLKNGTSWLRPLLQKTLASEIGVHPSTISRAIADKYVQTPQGLIQIKALCPREHKGYSAQRIQALIKDIVSQEDKNNPLSDEEIKEILRLEGVEIERRTIAAYRQKINVPSSSKRSSKLPS